MIKSCFCFCKFLKGGEMKCKIDFITNSSSTAYVVCIPESYDIGEEELEVLYQNYIKSQDLREKDMDDPKNVKDIVLNAIENLQNGNTINEYEFENTGHYTIGFLFYVLDQKEVVLGISDIGGGDGCSTIVGITEDTINKWIINNNLKRLNIIEETYDKNSQLATDKKM